MWKRSGTALAIGQSPRRLAGAGEQTTGARQPSPEVTRMVKSPDRGTAIGTHAENFMRKLGRVLICDEIVYVCMSCIYKHKHVGACTQIPA